MEEFTVSHVLALSIFTSYFLLIFFLLHLIISSIRSHANTQNDRKHVFLFSGLTLASFAHTGYWMFHFMAWSFHDFEHSQHNTQEDTLLRIATWLTDTALFEQAWSAVCASPLNWWWSEQLCAFTAGAFTIFLFMQRGRIPHIWAYMVLGQVVAISVAWSLLNLALVLIPSPRTTSSNIGKLPLSLTVPVLISLLNVSLSPYTSATTFLPNLLTMHGLLILPLLPFPILAPPRLSPRSTSFYTLVAMLSMLLRIRTTLAVLSTLHITSSPFFSLQYPVDALVGLWNAPGVVYGAAWDTLHSHPAQASIGWDVVWTSIVWLAWGLWGDRAVEETRWTASDLAMKVFPTAVASVGVVVPMEFGRALREDIAERENIKTE